MDIDTITIRPATHADARALASFGARTFRETFEPDNRSEDVAAYVAETKCGFRDVGSHEFVLGTDHQIDRVMVLPLDRSSLVSRCFEKAMSPPAIWPSAPNVTTRA